jgi:ATP synthase F1 gamma subunit
MLIRDIKQRIDQGKSLELISQTFTEIASAKLKRIRRGIEQNRSFFYDLSNIYSLVNLIAAKNGIKKEVKINKTAVVLISSNERFYGSITNKLLEFFLNQTRDKQIDRFVIGRTAHFYLNETSYAYPFKKITLKRDSPSREELQALTSQIKDYSQVLVFYSQFKSVLIQLSAVKDISQSVSAIDFSAGSEEIKELLKNIDYIVEPEVKLMLQFFDTQIKSLILEALFLEAELARTASRLIAMDTSQNEAKDYINSWQKQLGQAKKTVINSRILEQVQIINAIKKKQR